MPEADQLNTVFGIWRKIQKVDSAFAAILADGTPDVVTDAVTALYAAGHLVGGRVTWAEHGIDMAQP